jgi:hypothetical protein
LVPDRAFAPDGNVVGDGFGFYHERVQDSEFKILCTTAGR